MHNLTLNTGYCSEFVSRSVANSTIVLATRTGENQRERTSRSDIFVRLRAWMFTASIQSQIRVSIPLKNFFQAQINFKASCEISAMAKSTENRLRKFRKAQINPESLAEIPQACNQQNILCGNSAMAKSRKMPLRKFRKSEIERICLCGNFASRKSGEFAFAEIPQVRNRANLPLRKFCKSEIRRICLCGISAGNKSMKNALAENLQKVSQWKTLWRNFRQGLVNGKCFCGKSAKGSLQKNSLAENPQGLNYNVKLKVKKLKH